MYINPFWCGVIVTVLIEVVTLIGSAIYINIKEKRK